MVKAAYGVSWSISSWHSGTMANKTWDIFLLFYFMLFLHRLYIEIMLMMVCIFYALSYGSKSIVIKMSPHMHFLELIPGFNQSPPNKRATILSNPNYNPIQWPWETNYQTNEPIWPSYTYWNYQQFFIGLSYYKCRIIKLN